MAKAKPRVNRVNSLKSIFKSIIWPRKWLLLFGLILILFNRAAGLIIPASTKFLIDDIIGKNQAEYLSLFVLVVAVSVIVQSITSFTLTQLLSVEAQSLIAKLRVQVQKQVMNLPLSFFDDNKSGGLVSRIMNDVEGVRNLVGTGVVQMIGGLITSVGAFVILLNINAALTFYAILPMIIFSIIAVQAFKRIRPIFRERGVINAEVTGRLTETLSGIRVIKGFNAEAQEVSMFEKGVDRIFKNVKKSLVSTSFVTSAATFFLGLGSVGIMWYSGNKIIADQMTVGDLFAFTAILAFMVAPLVQMGNIGTQLTEAIAGLDRTEELMSQAAEDDDPNRTVQLESIKGDFKFDNVHFAYDEDKDVLHGISFYAPSGSVTALVGSSGSGKTTIASMVASFISPDEGTITLDDIDLSTVLLESYRKNLGVVLQDDFLFEGTIRENILFPRPNASEEELQQAVKAAYVSEFTDRFELGLETVIGERGVKLSGGQRQRVAIARAILADPRVLILDEATSNLDTVSEGYIQESLETLMKGRTTFVIAHRLSTIKKADNILVIENGSIVEQGNHETLINKQGRYYEMYTYQARI